MEKRKKEGEGACDHEGINWGLGTHLSWAVVLNS